MQSLRGETKNKNPGDPRRGLAGTSAGEFPGALGSFKDDPGTPQPLGACLTYLKQACLILYFALHSSPDHILPTHLRR
jgi:hypothetical protein